MIGTLVNSGNEAFNDKSSFNLDVLQLADDNGIQVFNIGYGHLRKVKTKNVKESNKEKGKNQKMVIANCELVIIVKAID